MRLSTVSILPPRFVRHGPQRQHGPVWIPRSEGARLVDEEVEHGQDHVADHRLASGRSDEAVRGRRAVADPDRDRPGQPPRLSPALGPGDVRAPHVPQLELVDHVLWQD